jgi:hypothetical protein
MLPGQDGALFVLLNAGNAGKPGVGKDQSMEAFQAAVAIGEALSGTPPDPARLPGLHTRHPVSHHTCGWA